MVLEYFSSLVLKKLSHVNCLMSFLCVTITLDNGSFESQGFRFLLKPIDNIDNSSGRQSRGKLNLYHFHSCLNSQQYLFLRFPEWYYVLG